MINFKEFIKGPLNFLHIAEWPSYKTTRKVFSDTILSGFIPEKLRSACLDVAECGLGLIQGYGWIAGGALRAQIAQETPGDLDLYFSEEKCHRDTLNFILSKQSLGAKIICDDEVVTKLQVNQSTYRSNFPYKEIDLIKKDFGKDPAQCIDKFDYTVCGFAIDTNNDVFWIDGALEDLENKKLVVHKPANVLTSLLRIQKYVKKGYEIDLEEANKFISHIRESSDLEIKRTYTRLGGRQKHLY